MRSILIRQMATPTEEPVARATDVLSRQEMRRMWQGQGWRWTEEMHRLQAREVMLR